MANNKYFWTVSKSCNEENTRVLDVCKNQRDAIRKAVDTVDGYNNNNAWGLHNVQIFICKVDAATTQVIEELARYTCNPTVDENAGFTPPAPARYEVGQFVTFQIGSGPKRKGLVTQVKENGYKVTTGAYEYLVGCWEVSPPEEGVTLSNPAPQKYAVGQQIKFKTLKGIIRTGTICSIGKRGFMVTIETIDKRDMIDVMVTEDRILSVSAFLPSPVSMTNEQYAESIKKFAPAPEVTPPANGLEWIDGIVDRLTSIRYVADVCGTDRTALHALRKIAADIDYYRLLEEQKCKR